MKLAGTSEQRLIDRFNDGDMGVFLDIYRKYMQFLCAFAEKIVDRETARDMVQDVFTKIWMNRETSPITDSFQSYLYRAVRNACINYLEHEKVKANYETRQMLELKIREVAYFQSPEQLLIQQERLNMINQAIESLPSKNKEIFKMAYFEDKKAAEIANELQLSVRTVETQIYKALKTLRAIFLNP